ncbi:MAG TPA: hypothetical protein VIM05_03225 [Gaiellaceae bacterium]|jgi:aryl-alcohol dehydrogenase-like predicted oxidoreductase
MAGVARLGMTFRFRALTPAQELAVQRAAQHGAAFEDLATAYGVSERTIRRAIVRERRATYEVQLAGHRATFELEDGAPVQVTPWVPE